jgi:hypothetical protein
VCNASAAANGREPTQTLNPDECFAIDARFQAAALSSGYSVKLAVNDVDGFHERLEKKKLEIEELRKRKDLSFTPQDAEGLSALNAKMQTVLCRAEPPPPKPAPNPEEPNPEEGKTEPAALNEGHQSRMMGSRLMGRNWTSARQQQRR